MYPRYEKFDDWFYEQESYGLRAERCWDTFDIFSSPEKTSAQLLIWLQSAFEAGRNSVNDSNQIGG